jgi:hypothetical protein
VGDTEQDWQAVGGSGHAVEQQDKQWLRTQQTTGAACSGQQRGQRVQLHLLGDEETPALSIFAFDGLACCPEELGRQPKLGRRRHGPWSCMACTQRECVWVSTLHISETYVCKSLKHALAMQWATNVPHRHCTNNITHREIHSRKHGGCWPRLQSTRTEHWAVRHSMACMGSLG